MSTVMGIDTAIGWAHWQLRGGVKNTIFTVSAVSGLLLLAIFLSVRAAASNPYNPTYNVLWGWRLALLWIEGGLLVLLAGSRVAASVRSDITSRMIESHRLMPVSPFTAISGYLWGPTLQSVCLAGAVFLIGLGVTLASGMDAIVWLGPSAIIATFALFWWMVMAFTASVTRASGGINIVFIFFGFMGQATGMLLVLPGIVVLMSPFNGKTIFQAQVSAGLEWQFAVSLLAQIYIGAILYIGAARKYRRAEDTALAIIPAIALLAGWVGMSVLTVERWDDFKPASFERIEAPQLWCYVASTMSATLLALVSIGNASRGLHPRTRIPLVILICATIICPLGLVMRSNVNDVIQPLILNELILIAMLVAAGFLLAIARFMQRRWIPMFFWILLSWVAPIVIDTIYWEMAESRHGFVMTSISSFSPVGSLCLLWKDPPVNQTAGLVFQCICAAAWMLLYYSTRPKSVVILKA